MNMNELCEEGRKERKKTEKTMNAIIAFAKREFCTKTPDNELITELFKRYYDNTLPQEIRNEIDEIKERRKPCVR